MYYFPILIFVALPLVAGQDDLQRPCSPLSDACIQSYFRERVGCSPNAATDGDTLLVKAHQLYLPSFNMTPVQESLIVTQLNAGVVQDFFFSSSANRLVMVVKFQNVYFNGTTTFKYRPQGSLSISTISDSYELYPELILTVTFGSVDYPDLNEINAVTYVTQPYSWSYGTGAEQVTDPTLVELFKIFTRDVDYAVRDCFLTRAVLMANYYVQNKFCDYGVDYTTVNWDALNYV